MPQRSAQPRIFAPAFEQQQRQWCGIGIHAVAAASLYCDPAAKQRLKLRNTAELPKLLRQTDYATD
jgi:hypothetical protein